MSIKSEPYYWLECDDCGGKSTEGGDFTAWGDHGQALDDASDSGWYVEDGHHWCEQCRPKHVCTECDKLAETTPETESMCPDCWKEAQP